MKPSSTFSQKKRPFQFNAANLWGSFFPSKPPLSEQYILDSALKSTRLDDWGSDSFLEGMRMLLDSCKKEARLHYYGRESLQRGCIRAVKDRLRLEKDIKDNPDILNTSIEKPVFILGLPRTGTSFLQNLFFRDNQFRSLHYWEQVAIGPQPTPENLLKNYIVKSCIGYVANLRKIAPEFFAAHEIRPCGPEECNGLMERNFSSILYFMFRNIPTYMEWFKNKDMTSTYEYHKKQLKFLGYHFQGKRWVLKAPVHLLFLKYLFKVYPDAKILQMHRDPLNVVPSMASLGSISRGIHSSKVNEVETAEQFLNLTSYNVNQSILYRQKTDNSQFFDIPYSELVNRPVETMKRIYSWLDVDFTSETELVISDWLEESNLKRSKNSHHYSLEQFKLSEKQIRDKFANYYETYPDYL